MAENGLAGALTTTKTLIERLKSSGGGCFILDDIHHLFEAVTSGELNIGSLVIDYLISEMQNYDNLGKIVFILTGSNKVFDYHPSLTAGLVLQDFTDEELLDALQKELLARYNRKMEVEGGLGGLYMRIVVRRIGRRRGAGDFKNMNELLGVFEEIRARQGERLTRERRAGNEPNDFWFTKEDLIGPNPSISIQKSKAWEKLKAMIGIAEVKQSVKSMIDLIETNYRRELQEKPPIDLSLNRVFLGNPGTGKTTVAKLYGEILKDMGFLSNGEVVVKSPADFLGGYLGQSENKTKAILAQSRGKVLIIDEAYTVCNPGNFVFLHPKLMSSHVALSGPQQ